MPIFGKERLVYTVKCCYNAVQFTMILHKALRWQYPNANQTSNSQQPTHTSPWRASYGVSILRIWGKIDSNIMAVHCTFSVYSASQEICSWLVFCECFAMFCNSLLEVNLPIFFRLTTLAYDCPSTSEATLKNMGKYGYMCPLNPSKLLVYPEPLNFCHLCIGIDPMTYYVILFSGECGDGIIIMNVCP